MDERTGRLLDALEHPGAAMLLELLAEPATEGTLVGSVNDAAQATANRRLARLADLRLIERESGSWRAPGRRWSLTQPDETDSLLQAAIGLSEALAAREERERNAAQRKLRAGRAKRRGLREAGSG